MLFCPPSFSIDPATSPPATPIAPPAPPLVTTRRPSGRTVQRRNSSPRKSTPRPGHATPRHATPRHTTLRRHATPHHARTHALTQVRTHAGKRACARMPMPTPNDSTAHRSTLVSVGPARIADTSARKTQLFAGGSGSFGLDARGRSGRERRLPLPRALRSSDPRALDPPAAWWQAVAGVGYGQAPLPARRSWWPGTWMTSPLALRAPSKPTRPSPWQPGRGGPVSAAYGMTGWLSMRMM